MKKIRVHYFLELLKFQKKKWSHFFHCWPLHRDIDHLCIWPVHEFDRNHLQGKSLFPEADLISFKVKKQHP